MKIEEIAKADLGTLTDEQLEAAARGMLKWDDEDRKRNAILYYRPASPEGAEVHKSTARRVGVFGGNRSGKTEGVIAQIAALATGVLPESIRDDLLPKFRGPVNCRIVVESLTATLHPIILPKLQHFKWVGLDRPGGEKGHWGWIPQDCLIDGEWEKSWSEKLRILRVLCRDPDDPARILGESSIQFMSFDQDWSDFASGSFHHIMIDEPPPYMIWRENIARTLDVSGILYLVMTWPEDRSIPVDWIYDEIWEPGQPGPLKNPQIDCFELSTLNNRFLPVEAIKEEIATWTEEQRQVKIFGKQMRFSNRIHRLFTDTPSAWCFGCGTELPHGTAACPNCQSDDIEGFCHVGEWDFDVRWPCVWLLDPHPRKPHMWMWAVIDPNDDIIIVRDGELDDTCAEVAEAVHAVEYEMHLNIAMRLMDPNMGASPSRADRRESTWQEDFEEGGLRIDLGDKSAVGRQRLDEYLKPDQRTRRPRVLIDQRCAATIFQMKRYTWDEHRVARDRDLKQQPREKYDDYPTLLKYLMNFAPSFASLEGGAPVLGRPGKRRGPYG